jgi:hypothetical protein
MALNIKAIHRQDVGTKSVNPQVLQAPPIELFSTSAIRSVAISTAPAPSVSIGSSTPLAAKSYSLLLKVFITTIILMGSAYFTIRTAYPFLKEIAAPSIPSGPTDQNAATGVKVLQQTRIVIAKNNANDDHLNTLIDDPLGLHATAPLAAQIKPAPLSPQPVAAKPNPQIEVRLEPLSGLVLDDLHISSVVGGRSPRIMINRVLVGIGGVVDVKRSLRFVSIDETKRVVVFGNGQETIEKRY